VNTPICISSDFILTHSVLAAVVATVDITVMCNSSSSSCCCCCCCCWYNHNVLLKG